MQVEKVVRVGIKFGVFWLVATVQFGGGQYCASLCVGINNQLGWDRDKTCTDIGLFGFVA